MDAGGPKMSSQKKLTIFLIAILLLSSVARFYLARTQFSELYLTATPLTQPPGPPHDLIAFDQQGFLVGVSMKGGRFRLDRFNLDSHRNIAKWRRLASPCNGFLGLTG